MSRGLLASKTISTEMSSRLSFTNFINSPRCVRRVKGFLIRVTLISNGFTLDRKSGRTRLSKSEAIKTVCEALKSPEITTTAGGGM